MLALDSNAFLVTREGETKEFCLYKVTFTQFCKSIRAAIAAVAEAIGSDVELFFDGYECLVSPVETLAETVSSSTLKLEFLRKVSFDSDFVLLAKMCLARAMGEIGYGRCDEGFYSQMDAEDFGRVRVVDGFKMGLQKVSTGAIVTWSVDSRIERKETLGEFLSGGVTDRAVRGELEAAARSMAYVTTHGMNQKSVQVVVIDWEPDDEKRKKVSAERQLGSVVKRGDPIVECYGGDLYPASVLLPTDLTLAEKNDSVLFPRIRECVEPSVEVVRRRIETLVSVMRSNEEAQKLFAYFGLKIGENMKANGSLLEKPELNVRDKATLSMISIPPGKGFKYSIEDKCVAIPPMLNKPPLVVCDEVLEIQVREQFVPALLKVAAEMGVTIKCPSGCYIKAAGEYAYLHRVKQEIKETGLPSIIIVIVDAQRTDFGAFRSYMALELGVPVYFISASSIFDASVKNKSLMQSYVRDIVVETGGVPSYASLPLRSTIAMGVTCYKNHELSVSASFDHTLARYRYDLLDFSQLHTFLDETIALFKKFTSIEPTTLIVYAMTDSDMKEFSDKLIQALETNLKITICFVNIRASVRFFECRNGTYQNPPPGTIVSNTITDNSNSFFIHTKDSADVSYDPFECILFRSDFDTTLFATITLGLCYCFPKISKMDRLPAPMAVARENFHYCYTWLKGKPPAPPLKESLLQFF